MGAIGTFREKGISDKTFLEDLYPSFKILYTTRKGGVIYSAATNTRLDDGVVFALVMPFNSCRGEFIVKEQDETQGPYDTEAPAKLLDLLSDTDSEYALEWRAKCRATIAKAAADKQRAKAVTAGTTIQMVEPVWYGDRYGSFDTFTYSGKGSGFTAYRDGYGSLSVSLSKWRSRDYKVVS